MYIYLIKQFNKKISKWDIVAVIYNNLNIAKEVCFTFALNYPNNRFKIEKVGCVK